MVHVNSITQANMYYMCISITRQTKTYTLHLKYPLMIHTFF